MKQMQNKNYSVMPYLKDIFISAAMILAASLGGYVFWRLGFSDANIIMLYILGVLIISVVTSYQVYSLIASFVSIVVFNFFFTEPRFTLVASDKDYPVTFLTMFVAAFITGSLAARLKEQAKKSAMSEYRTKILFETNHLLERVKERDKIITVTATQLMKLLNRDMVVYLTEKNGLSEPVFFRVESFSQEGQENEKPAFQFEREGQENKKSVFRSERERWENKKSSKKIIPDMGAGDAETSNVSEKEISDSQTEKQTALWVLKHSHCAGAGTQTFPEARYYYLSIRTNEEVYGVVGISVRKHPLDSFESSILRSILGECALALENEKNAREKAEAALIAQKEQLRANLLRSISHDLRTPLTSISGNASNLLSNGELFDAKTKKQLYSDIYEDSMWLIDLVENILSITRIEEGRLNLRLSTELLEEVVSEALQHISSRRTEHKITVQSQDEFILVKVDAKLVMQVVINIIDNAIKYTQKDSKIQITLSRTKDWAFVCISDDGPGIPDEVKPHIFDMFYSGAKNTADSRRSLGLGLALCRSIVTAHGGTLEVSDNLPHGTVFTFSLPLEEVDLHE